MTEYQIKIYQRIQNLENALKKLKKINEIEEKIRFLDETNELNLFFSKYPSYAVFFEKFIIEEQLILKSLILIGQENIFLALASEDIPFKSVLKHLIEINRFYGGDDGLIFYQLSILKLLLEYNLKSNHSSNTEQIHYLKPVGKDLSKDSREIRKYVRQGIENLPQVGEIYPVGGAGERLKLSDIETKKLLPVALLPFLGFSLLEGLIRDLQAREFLYFKLTSKQWIVPVAMMTSEENQNHEIILKLCKSKRWFNRGKSRFNLFSQPMVPVVTEDGDWLLSSQNQLMLKPSGHGVIWKLASEVLVFDWFKSFNCHKLLSRQINNPVAGVDLGLLGFSGVGILDNHSFGFCSCDRHVGSSEGMDVLIEKKTATGWEYKISNIEYTEFIKNGIEDKSEFEGGGISQFPTNTNILFLDILEIEKALKKCAIPGMLLNMKTTIPYIDSQGLLKTIKIGRLESTMQNIADVIVDQFPDQLASHKDSALSSYITFNERKKTISVTKKAICKKNIFTESPESCLFDILSTYHDLFSNYCGFKLPVLNECSDYLLNGPSFFICFHPALGPLYSVIAQKIRKGELSKNSELQLEITELDIENLKLDGSLLILADQPLGLVDQEGILQYGKNLGKCRLKNVVIQNKGINRKVKNCYWKNEIKRHESLTILLQGNAEFVAEDVTFLGDFHFEVADGERLRVTSKDGKLCFSKEKIEEESFYWSYAFDEEDRVILSLNDH